MGALRVHAKRPRDHGAILVLLTPVPGVRYTSGSGFLRSLLDSAVSQPSSHSSSLFPVPAQVFMRPDTFIRELITIMGPEGVLSRPEELMLYEYDGLSALETPDAVVFPTITDQVVRMARLAAVRKVPIIPRG